MIEIVTYLHKNIVTARLARATTQQQLADRMGISRTTLFLWESAAPESAPTHLQVMQLGKQLGVHPQRLLFEDSEMFRTSFGSPPPLSRHEPEEDGPPPRRGKSKVGAQQRLEILAAVEERGESLRVVAKRHGVSHSTVRHIVLEMRASKASRPRPSHVTARGAQ